MGFTFKGTHVIDYQNHTLATGARGYKPPFTSSCGHSVHIHGGGSHALLANIDLHTCVGGRHSPISRVLWRPWKRRRQGRGFLCVFIFNEPHANEMEKTPQKNQPPEALGRRAQRLRLSGLPRSPEQTCGGGGLSRVCPPTPGSQDQLQHPCCCGGRGPSGRGRLSPLMECRRGGAACLDRW